MRKVDMDNEMTDELRSGYDFKSLRVRKMGAQRTSFRGFVQLAPDVIEVFPNAEAVNEALRFLIRMARENKPATQFGS